MEECAHQFSPVYSVSVGWSVHRRVDEAAGHANPWVRKPELACLSCSVFRSVDEAASHAIPRALQMLPMQIWKMRGLQQAFVFNIHGLRLDKSQWSVDRHGCMRKQAKDSSKGLDQLVNRFNVCLHAIARVLPYRVCYKLCFDLCHVCCKCELAWLHTSLQQIKCSCMFPCDVIDPWVRWQRWGKGPIGIIEFVLRRFRWRRMEIL